MKCSLDKVLTDARQLANRMRARDEEVENLLSQASSVHSRLEGMRQYQEEVLSLNELSRRAPSRPRSQLVLCLAAENKQLEQLRQENEALKSALDEHQGALELIMTKYRTQMTRMMRSNRVEKSLSSGGSTNDSDSAAGSSNEETSLVVTRLLDRMSDMAAVVRYTNNEGEQVAAETEALIHRLIVENEGLRELLQIGTEATHQEDSIKSSDTANND